MLPSLSSMYGAGIVYSVLIVVFLFLKPSSFGIIVLIADTQLLYPNVYDRLFTIVPRQNGYGNDKAYRKKRQHPFFHNTLRIRIFPYCTVGNRSYIILRGQASKHLPQWVHLV